MAEKQTRAEIEADIERLKQAVHTIGERAAERAYYIPQDGLNIGEKGNQLYTGGIDQIGAPKIHPVWAPEVEHEARTVERMGAATFEYEPLYRKLQEWAEAGKPEIDLEGEYAQGMKALQERANAFASAETPTLQEKQGVRY